MSTSNGALAKVDKGNQHHVPLSQHGATYVRKHGVRAEKLLRRRPQWGVTGRGSVVHRWNGLIGGVKKISESIKGGKMKKFPVFVVLALAMGATAACVSLANTATVSDRAETDRATTGNLVVERISVKCRPT